MQIIAHKIHNSSQLQWPSGSLQAFKVGKTECVTSVHLTGVEHLPICVKICDLAAAMAQDIAQSCMSADAHARPTFDALVVSLRTLQQGERPQP